MTSSSINSIYSNALDVLKKCRRRLWSWRTETSFVGVASPTPQITLKMYENGYNKEQKNCTRRRRERRERWRRGEDTYNFEKERLGPKGTGRSECRLLARRMEHCSWSDLWIKINWVVWPYELLEASLNASSLIFILTLCSLLIEI